jgi:hypothetical protein
MVRPMLVLQYLILVIRERQVEIDGSAQILPRRLGPIGPRAKFLEKRS